MKHTILKAALLAASVLLAGTSTRAGDPGLPAAATPGMASAPAASSSTRPASRRTGGAVPPQSLAAANQPPGVAQTPYGWHTGFSHRGGRALVINSSPLGRTNVAGIEEDLSIMARILEKALDEDARSARATRYGIVATSLAKDRLPGLYLEGYGAVFFLNTQAPLVPPPARETAEPKPSASRTWESTRQELYGGGTPAGAAAHWGGAAPVEYDEKLVEQLKAKLLQALKEAAHLRCVKPDEFITLAVFGPFASAIELAAGAEGDAGQAQPSAAEGGPQSTSGPAANRVGAPAGSGGGGGMGGGGFGMGAGASTGDSMSFFSTAQLPSGRIGTTLTIRVKKADVDAFAAEKLSAEEFQGKAAINAYVGNAGSETGMRSAIYQY